MLSKDRPYRMNWRKINVFAFLALFFAAERIPCGFAGDEFPPGLTEHASSVNIAGSEELLRLTNQSRIAQGLLPLTADANLMRLAREHAEEMAIQGFISHNQPSGNVAVRMNRAGYKYETVRENLIKARMIPDAHSDLLKSPDHNINILATDVTHIGIGIAKGDPERHGGYLFIAEIFTLPRNDYEPSQIKESLTDHVEKLQRENLVHAKQNSTLEKMASGSLDTLSDSYTREDLRNLLAKSADELHKTGHSGISRLEISVQLLSNPDQIRVPATIRHGLAGMYGAAVRRITGENNRPVFLLLTLAAIPRYAP